MLNGQKLQQIRILKNITQAQIAKELGCTKNYISMVENGKETPTEEKYEKWIHALNYVKFNRLEPNINDENARKN